MRFIMKLEDKLQKCLLLFSSKTVTPFTLQNAEHQKHGSNLREEHKL
jgi:hypothetical protein